MLYDTNDGESIEFKWWAYNIERMQREVVFRIYWNEIFKLWTNLYSKLKFGKYWVTSFCPLLNSTA